MNNTKKLRNYKNYLWDSVTSKHQTIKSKRKSTLQKTLRKTNGLLKRCTLKNKSAICNCTSKLITKSFKQTQSSIYYYANPDRMPYNDQKHQKQKDQIIKLIANYQSMKQNDSQTSNQNSYDQYLSFQQHSDDNQLQSQQTSKADYIKYQIFKKKIKMPQRTQQFERYLNRNPNKFKVKQKQIKASSFLQNQKIQLSYSQQQDKNQHLQNKFKAFSKYQLNQWKYVIQLIKEFMNNQNKELLQNIKQIAQLNYNKLLQQQKQKKLARSISTKCLLQHMKYICFNIQDNPQQLLRRLNRILMEERIN